MHRRVIGFILLWCFAMGSAWAVTGLFSGARDAEFLDAASVFKLGEVRQDVDGFIAAGSIAEGYYVYRHSLKLIDALGQPLALDLPAGVSKHDEFFGDTEIFSGSALQLRLPASASGVVTLHWQGCAQAGICYPPQTMRVQMPQTPAPVGQAQPLEALGEDQAAAHRLASLGPVMGTLLFFGFGLLLAFTPCTLPMIPILSTMVVGSRASPRRALVLSLSYVLAMAGTYAAVGVAAGLAGANLQATLQSPWLLGAFSLLFLILASSLFGLFELQLPTALVKRVESAGRGTTTGGSVGGAAALGLLSALLVGPCMTAPLAGALLYIGQTGSAMQGGLALFATGLGMGLPLLAIAVFGARVLPKPGAWMERVRIAFGYVMVAMAISMLARFLPATAGLTLWGAWLLALAMGLVAWAQALTDRKRAVWMLRFSAAITCFWSILILVGAASGANSLLQPLAHLRGSAPAATAASGVRYVAAKSVADVDAQLAKAAARGEWTLIDFYADWCVSCHVIERNVFQEAAVAQRLSRLQVVRPDVTRNDAQDQALLKHWGVMGPPTLMLIGPDGQERRDLRVVGEIDARAFLARLDAAGIP